MRTTLYHAVLAAALAASAVGTAEAQGPYLTSNRLGYTGTIERYGTLADAQSQTNAVAGSPFAVPQRDLGFFIVHDNSAYANWGYPPGTYPGNAFDFLTFWYSAPNTPHNTNYGFVQISDEDGGSVTLASGVWTNASMTEFLYNATGANTTPGCAPYTPYIAVDCPRLWNAGSAPGSGETTAGTFLTYEMQLLASGLTPATFNPVTGVFDSFSDPTSVSGYFRGIFWNTSVEDPSSNGFYRVNLSLNLTSWAAEQDQGSLYYPNVGYSEFGSATVVPEPSTYALMAVGLAGVMGVARRRRKASSALS